MKRRTKVLLWICGVLVIGPPFCFGCFLIPLVAAWYDFKERPAMHIRNDKYVVGLYGRGFGFQTSGDALVTLVDLDTFSKSQRPILRVDADHNCSVSDMQFLSPEKIRVNVVHRSSVFVTCDLNLKGYNMRIGNQP